MLWLPALLALASFVKADVFGTCGGIGTLGGDGLVPGLVPLLTGTLTTLLGTTLAGNECRDLCRAGGYKFMIFAEGIDVNLLVVNLDETLGSCYCSNEGLDVRSITEGSGAFGDCESTILNLVGVEAEYIAETDLTLDGCYATNPPAISTFTVANQAECLEACGSNSQVSLRVAGLTESCGLLGGVLGALLGGRSGGRWECSCSNTAPTGQLVNCNAQTSVSGVCGLLGGSRTRNYAWNVYSRDLAVSAIPRRRRSYVQRAASETYCPLPKLPCRVPGHDSFECLDTTTELEACGGCPNGNFLNGTVSGIDCTSLPGVSLGGISCVDGQCVASACRSGFKLIDGECVFQIRK
ncbi:hypothetical protein CC85DRAFT_313086 [Cutaneotrichosporon oleaginosum]|uniref:Protein CPL1-like domain-containing protein n=1 Tax=Cutaneotrichosporon oleaginosum TaxID=879819 RepID=A0A0J0XIJ5_9TREE|nr:uncharacterized protein CC85DRAFT_313086 [Cutaneotrichosporon oleaginosum]KLT40893.1 hypothetical protein CC85DRAFT_313086 [Cutaneotrichosporon oleaginosum]